MSVTSVPAPGDAPEGVEPPFAPKVVEELFTQLDKTIRAHLLYQGNHNNPTYARSLELTRAAFAAVWAQGDSITLSVAETALTWCGAVVLKEEGKSADSLAWMLFKDGLRELTLQQGFEERELLDFLAIIPKVRRAGQNDDDLLTLLWESEFTFLHYRYVDVAGDGKQLDSSPEPGRWPRAGGDGADTRDLVDETRDETQGGSAAAAPRPGIVKMDDFDATLYFLDEKEVEYLRRETQREYTADLRRGVLDSLLDIFEFQLDPLVRAEVLEHVESLMLHLLSSGQFATVAYLLKETTLTLERARDVEPGTRARLSSLAARLSEPTALSQLLEAMDQAPTLPAPQDLNELFAQLLPSALATVFAWLGRTQNHSLRPILEGAATRIAESATGELVKLIASTEPGVALEAVRRTGAMKTAAGVPALGKVLDHGDRELRLAALTALGEIGSPGALQAMERALADADRDVRVGVARSLTAKQYRPALARVEAAVKGKELREADRTERLAFFELYGALCGDAGVPFLDGILNAKGGLFARKEDPEVRACAAVALGRVNTASAKESLRRADGDKDVIVRNAVNRAIRGAGA